MHSPINIRLKKLSVNTQTNNNILLVIINFVHTSAVAQTRPFVLGNFQFVRLVFNECEHKEINID